jgi:hypothetical protein
MRSTRARLYDYDMPHCPPLTQTGQPNLDLENTMHGADYRTDTKGVGNFGLSGKNRNVERWEFLVAWRGGHLYSNAQ